MPLISLDSAGVYFEVFYFYFLFVLILVTTLEIFDMHSYKINEQINNVAHQTASELYEKFWTVWKLRQIKQHVIWDQGGEIRTKKLIISERNPNLCWKRTSLCALWHTCDTCRLQVTCAGLGVLWIALLHASCSLNVMADKILHEGFQACVNIVPRDKWEVTSNWAVPVLIISH